MKLPGHRMKSLAILLAAASSPVIVAADAGVFAQDLLKVTASDKVVAALWTRRPDSYTLQVVFDPYRFVASGLPVTTRPVSGADNGRERNSFFIGNTIANLRCLDPTFGGRTLTLIDGRRAVTGSPGVAAAPAQVPQAPPVLPAPRSARIPQVKVWLLRADGTLVQPVLQSPLPARAGECRSPNDNEVLFRFGIADGEQAVAAAIGIDDEYYIDKLQPLTGEASP